MIRKHKRIVFFLIASTLFALFTSSCGTVRGVGEDIGSLGRGLKKAAS